MKKTIMKDLRMLGMLLMAGSALMACSSDDELAQQPTQADAPKVYTVTVEGAQKGGDPASTRSTLADGGTTVSAEWATTDKVYVMKSFPSYTTATGTLSPTAAGTTAKLSGQLSGVTFTKDDGINLFTYDPQNYDFSNPSSYGGQDGTLKNIGEKYDFCLGSGKVSAVDDGNITISLDDNGKFGNMYAIVKFTLVDKANTATKLKPSKLTVKIGSTNSFDVTPTAATWTANGDGVLYVAVPDIGENDVTLTATVGTDTYTCTATNQKFDTGKFYRITAQMEKPAKTLAQATTDDIGKIAGADGKIYATKAAAEAVATGNAVAMIAYVGNASDCSHGLAIALADEGDKTWSAAGTACSGKTTVTGGTWRLPSIKDWQYMFICGASGIEIDESTSMSYSELASKLSTAGGVALQEGTTSFYWSSKRDENDEEKACPVLLDESSAAWGGTRYMDNTYHVRACLAF